MAGLGERLVASMAQLETLLNETASVSATFDPARVELPGVWLQSKTVDVHTLDGTATHRVWAYLLVPDTGAEDSHKALGELLDKVLDVLDPDAEVVTDQALTLPHNPTPMPAYRVVVDLDI